MELFNKVNKTVKILKYEPFKQFSNATKSQTGAIARLKLISNTMTWTFVINYRINKK